MKRKDQTDVHQTMRLLYQVARTQAGIEGPTQLAAFFNVAHGTVNKWEERGVPAQIAIDAQVLLGIDANLLSPNPDRPTSPLAKMPTPNPMADPLIREAIDMLTELQAKDRGVLVAHMRSLHEIMSPHKDGPSVPVAG